MNAVKDTPLLYRPYPAPVRAAGTAMAGSDVLTLMDFSPAEITSILDEAQRIRSAPPGSERPLAGKSIIMLFEKPSLRTRITFEVGIARLGGHPIYFDHGTQRLGERESVFDYAKNLERWVDGIVARVYSQQVLNELAAATRVPVVNALSDLYHPCQALADYLTLRERFGDLHRVRLAYVGDGNNVCHSLMHAAALLGSHLVVVTPEGYEPLASELVAARAIAATTGGSIMVTRDPSDVKGCQAVYTDVWVSMGQADLQGKRMKAFKGYQVDGSMMALAGPDAAFMHCLPAHRGVEVTDEVMDSKNSIVYDQAENRLHAQNGLLSLLFA